MGPLESAAERANTRQSGSIDFSSRAQSMMRQSPDSSCFLSTAVYGSGWAQADGSTGWPSACR